MGRYRAFNGQVSCPARGIINVEVCYSCPRLTRLRQSHGAPVVCCEAPTIATGRLGHFSAGRPGGW